ncbi:MAG: hypothetical protein LBG52_05635 [Candidatus Peribacteria bacterium]|jgi:hypothetical protein|nr:hypothetical protein [Candidatus Peribacteria bacterium]
MRVSLPDAFYILENMKNMDEMEAELLEFPSYLSGDMQKEKIIDNVQKFLNENPFSTVNHDEKRYPFKFKERKDEVLEKPREEERAIPKVSLHDVPLDD